MPTVPKQARTEDSNTFDPDEFFRRWDKEEVTPPYDNDFRKFIIKAFDLPHDDDYRYVAVAEVTLLQAQTHVEFGAQGGLHAWYRDENNQPRGNPSASDVSAYTDIFRPSTHTGKALTALASNARKESIRADVAKHLQSLYRPHSTIVVSKKKRHTNPYFDVWTWTCQNLEWGGPESGTARIKNSHAVLPILYHHFGCVVPSYESLVLIQQVAGTRRILDMGSGNGYWTYMLRSLEPFSVGKERRNLEVVPIDNGMSEWRTTWVGDTVQADGIQWLVKNRGGDGDVLLLVYPVVGNDFTSKIIKAYRGTTIISAGSQNTSGFTAFAKDTFAGWMQREMPGWEQTLQVPLPSFAGKDEALFVFQRR